MIGQQTCTVRVSKKLGSKGFWSLSQLPMNIAGF